MRLRKFFLLLPLALAAGCTVQGYEGPPRDEKEISTLTVKSSGSAAIRSIKVGERTFNGIADVIQLLPGNHDFEVSYEVADRDTCPHDDSYCHIALDYGVCEGWVKTLPGRAYLLTLSNRGSYVSATVLAKGYFDFLERSDEANVGAASCGLDSY